MLIKYIVSQSITRLVLFYMTCYIPIKRDLNHALKTLHRMRFTVLLANALSRLLDDLDQHF
jgi:hypothetical protein